MGERNERLVTINDEKVVEALTQIGESIFCPDKHRQTYRNVASLSPTRINQHYRLSMLFMLIIPAATDLHVFLRPAFDLCPAKMLILASEMVPIQTHFLSGKIVEPEFCSKALNTYNRLMIDERDCDCRVHGVLPSPGGVGSDEDVF